MYRRSLLAAFLLVCPALAQDPVAPEVRLDPVRVLVDAPLHELAGTTAALSPDAKSLLTTYAYAREPATLRDATTGRAVSVIANGKTGAVDGVFLDDDRFAIQWGADLKQITIHDRKTSAVLQTLELEMDRFSARAVLAISKHGDRLVAFHRNAEVFDTRTGKRLFRIESPFPRLKDANAKYRTTRITDDGAKLLLGDNGRWRVFSMDDGVGLSEPREVGFRGAVAFSPDGVHASIACFPIDGFYDVMTGAKRPAAKVDRGSLPSLKPTSQNIFFDASSFSPDGKRWAGQYHNEVFVFDLSVDPPRLLHRLLLDDSATRSMTWSLDGKRVLVAGTTNGMSADEAPWIGDFNVETGEPWSGLAAHGNTIVAVDVAPDGSEFLTADIRGQIVRWSIPDLKPLQTRSAPRPGFAGSALEIAKYLTDGKQILMGGENVRFTWMTRQDLRTTSTFQSPGTSIWATSPDGSLILSDWSTDRPRIQLFRPPGTKPAHELDLADRTTEDARFTPDGKALVVEGSEALEVYDNATMKRTRTLAYSETSASRIEVSPDGRWAFGLSDGTVSAWKLDGTAQKVATSWSLPIRRPTSVSVSNGGELALVCGADEITVIELASGQMMSLLRLSDAAPRLARTLPGTPFVAVVSSARRLETYDLRELLRTSQFDKLATGELWKQIDGSPASAYAALIELGKRHELLPRLAETIESAKQRREISSKATDLIAKLDDAGTREAAHRELERLAPQVGTELRAALARSSGEKAERLATILRFAGDAPPSDGLKLARICEVLSWANEPSDRAALKALRP